MISTVQALGALNACLPDRLKFTLDENTENIPRQLCELKIAFTLFLLENPTHSLSESIFEKEIENLYKAFGYTFKDIQDKEVEVFKILLNKFDAEYKENKERQAGNLSQITLKCRITKKYLLQSTLFSIYAATKTELLDFDFMTWDEEKLKNYQFRGFYANLTIPNTELLNLKKSGKSLNIRDQIEYWQDCPTIKHSQLQAVYRLQDALKKSDEYNKIFYANVVLPMQKEFIAKCETKAVWEGSNILGGSIPSLLDVEKELEKYKGWAAQYSFNMLQESYQHLCLLKLHQILQPTPLILPPKKVVLEEEKFKAKTKNTILWEGLFVLIGVWAFYIVVDQEKFCDFMEKMPFFFRLNHLELAAKWGTFTSVLLGAGIGSSILIGFLRSLSYKAPSVSKMQRHLPEGGAHSETNSPSSTPTTSSATS